MKHKEPIPNRLVETPPELYARLDGVTGFDLMTKSLRKVVSMAYGRGYSDGYRDGRTDAENGHDERVRASLS